MAESTEKSNKEKDLKMLKVSYDMYENTKKMTEKNMKEALNQDGTRKYSEDDIKSKLNLITTAQDEIVRDYVNLGGKEEDLRKKGKKKSMTGDKKSSIDASVIEMVKESNEKDGGKANIEPDLGGFYNERLEQDYIPKKGDYNPEAAFDVIPLPSKGEGYKDKISKASVAYLTAYDENMIVSPNLYRDNLILDYLIQEKLLSKEVEPMDLLEGDRDAIILFLRASGYGNEYPITATDEETGKEFDTIVDLSKLKYKEFNLKGDSNGWFEFKLPVSGKVVKFRFPTHRDNLILEKLQKSEEPRLMKETISRYVDTLDAFVENDKDIDMEKKSKLRKSIRLIESWGDDMDDENAIKFNHTLTNRMNLLIMSVDGITDREYINNFIKKMNVRDSTALRKYMQKNEPGVDYTITVERPESLGGGSFETFLQLDQYIFLNIPE
jgi:hypothetical protein